MAWNIGASQKTAWNIGVSQTDPGGSSSNISKVSSVPIASVGKVSGVDSASISKIAGVTK